MTLPRTIRRVQVVVVTIAVAGLLATACGSSDSASGDSTTTAPVAEETTTTTQRDSPGQLIEFHEFSVGECFDERIVVGQGQVDIEVPGVAGTGTETETDESTPTTTTSEERFLVPCSLPHDNEIYVVTAMDDPTGAAFPGTDAITEFADKACFESFEAYVGQQYELSALEIGYLVPNEESWLVPDREVVCFVFNRSGPKLEGSVEGLGL